MQTRSPRRTVSQPRTQNQKSRTSSPGAHRATREKKLRRAIGIARGGRLIVVSGPSGGGKTTIAHEVLRRTPSLQFSVSATTRPRRENELDGKDYVFLTREEFERRVKAGDFVEWEEIYGQMYGTLKQEIERAFNAGRDLLFDVDVNGAMSIKKHYPGAVLIFIRPPDEQALVERLKRRHTENDAMLARRLARVPMELEKGWLFDANVINNDLPKATEAVQQIVKQALQKS